MRVEAMKDRDLMIVDSRHLKGVSYASLVRITNRAYRGCVEKTSAEIMDWTAVGCEGNEVVGGDRITCPRCPTLGIRKECICSDERREPTEMLGEVQSLTARKR